MADPPTLRTILANATATLGERMEAEMLLVHVLERDRAWLFAHADAVPDATARSRFEALVSRRAVGEPVAYLTGRRGFWTLELAVSPATLIPRPETEVLVEQALQRLPAGQPCSVADLGTGSGAVALALAAERPLATVLATDASTDALAVARANAERLGITNATFAHGEWLEPLAGRHVDVLVSNPPYVAAADPHLERGDLRFEPSAALVSGVDGLDAIRIIVRDAPGVLAPRGWLLLEHGHDQGAAVRALLHESGYTEIFTTRDLEARERVTGARRTDSRYPAH